MKSYLKGQNVRVRCRKSYENAHNHILIGKVLEENEAYLVIEGRTFHFKRFVDRDCHQIHCGETAVRVVPWDNVEIVNLLGYNVGLRAEIGFDERGNLILNDKRQTVIAPQREKLGV